MDLICMDICLGYQVGMMWTKHAKFKSIPWKKKTEYFPLYRLLNRDSGIPILGYNFYPMAKANITPYTTQTTRFFSLRK